MASRKEAPRRGVRALRGRGRVTSTVSAAEGGENKAGVCSRAGVFLVPQLGCEKLFTCKHRLPPRGRTGTEGRSKMRQVRVSILALGGAGFWGVGQEGSPVNASWFLVGSGKRWDSHEKTTRIWILGSKFPRVTYNDAPGMRPVR